MFTHIGDKVKTIAITVAVLGILGFVIYGIVLAINVSIISGVLVGLFGAMASWIVAIPLYGFGELIESNIAINQNLVELNSRMDRIEADMQWVRSSLPAPKGPSGNTAVPLQDKETWICSKCGKPQSRHQDKCWQCGTPRT